MTTIAEALNIDPAQERVWRIDGVQYVYTPQRSASFTTETLTRQRIRGQAADSNFLAVGRLQYLSTGWAAKNAALFA